MYDELERLGIYLTDEKKELFDRFAALFKEYNSKINLMSRNDTDFLFEKHIYDSLAFNLFIKKYGLKPPVRLADIGTGGGFPAVVLALYYDDYKITAVDSINKKINFIKHAAAELKINNIEPICARMEDLAQNRKKTYDIITARAVADLRIILEYAAPYLKTGGYLIAYKSIKAEEEAENAKNALKILNLCITDKIEYSLPLKQINKRVLLIIKKEKETPLIYPRKNPPAKKNPL